MISFAICSSFILTFLIETAIICFFIKKINLETAGKIFLINFFTWPIANLVYGFYSNLWIIESGVILAESLLIMFLFKLSYKKSFIISFAANFASTIIGIAFLSKILY